MRLSKFIHRYQLPFLQKVVSAFKHRKYLLPFLSSLFFRYLLPFLQKVVSAFWQKRVAGTLLVASSLFLATSAFAHPPTLVDLSYSLDTQTLRVEFRHVSRDRKDHRIRRIYVFLNDEEIKKYVYVQQPSAYQIVENLNIELKDGDLIRVKAICSEAGILEVPAAFFEEEGLLQKK